MRFLLPLAVLVFAVAPAVVRAQAILSTEHVDLGVAFENGVWDLHVHDETNDVEYAPEDAVLALGANTLVNRPASSSFAFIGVGANQPYFRLNESFTPGRLLLGLGPEEIDPADFAVWDPGDARLPGAGKWIRLDLLSYTGPGQISVWSSDDINPIVFVSTFENGVDSTDSLFALAGGHTDYNWGFSEEGEYEITVRASGVLSDNSVSQSAAATYRFQVSAAPEPSTIAYTMAGIGCLVTSVGIRRRNARR